MPAARPAHFAVLATCLALASTTSVWAQTSKLPVTAEQRRTADQVASAGVPLSELAPKAPDQHVVKAGDTLFIMEVMKTEVPHQAEAGGKVTAVHVKDGQEGLDAGTLAVVIE